MSQFLVQCGCVEADDTPQKLLWAQTMLYIGLLADAPNQAESLLHDQGQAEGGIGLQVNANKTRYMYFNQEGDISTLNLSCYGSKGYGSDVLGDSEVKFLEEGEDAAFCPFLYCVLVIYGVAEYEQ